MIEQINVENLSRHTRNNKYGFTKGQSCRSSLITSHNDITSLVDECSAMQCNADGLSCPRLVELWDRMGWASQGIGGSGMGWAGGKLGQRLVQLRVSHFAG